MKMKKCVIKTCKNSKEENLGHIGFYGICQPCYEKFLNYTNTDNGRMSPKEAYCFLWIDHQNLKQELWETRDKLNLANAQEYLQLYPKKGKNIT